MTLGANAPVRTTPPRQPGSARTTRREPTSATAASATSATVRIAPLVMADLAPHHDADLGKGLGLGRGRGGGGEGALP